MADMTDENAERFGSRIAALMEHFPVSRPIFGDGNCDDESPVVGMVFALDEDTLDRCTIAPSPPRGGIN